MPPAARRSMAGTSRRPRGVRIDTAAGRRGPTPSSRTTPSSASACASRATSRRSTRGQMSKGTPRGAVAKFAAGGKPLAKKDLGLLVMSYGNVYVASVAMGADDMHTVKAFLEAEAYPGPSLIIAYSHCIAHGYDLV